MLAVTIIGLDIAKSVFQVHGADAAGNAVIRKKLQRAQVLTFFKRLPPCLVGIDACATSHFWSRELQAPAISVLCWRSHSYSRTIGYEPPCPSLCGLL
jgi:transposase